MLRTLALALVSAALLAPAAQARHDLGPGTSRLRPARASTNVAPLQARIQAAASWAAGREVSIACETAEQVRARTDSYALAYVVLDGSSVLHLGPSACGWLAGRTPLFGEGLLVVLHEALHLRLNSVDESLVTCRARELMRPALARFFPDVPATQAVYWAERLFQMMPDEYRHCA